MDRLLQLGPGGLQVRERNGRFKAIMVTLILQPPAGMAAPMMDTAEMVYISSLALLKVKY